jgi:hypothetical protein
MPDSDRDGPYAVVAAEARERPVRYTPLEVIDGSGSVIGFPGSLSVFLAVRGSPVLDDVRAAARGDEQIAQRLRSRYLLPGAGEDDGVSSEELAELMLAAPVFADFMYGGQVVNRGLFLPDGADLLVTALAYSGGRLSSEGCVLAEHYRSDSDLHLDAVVVQVAPPLTDAERSLFDVTSLDGRVAAAACEHTTWWQVAGIAFVVGTAITTAAAITIAVGQMLVDEELDHLTADEMAGVDPSASIDRLLEIRRRLLLNRLDDGT